MVRRWYAKIVAQLLALGLFVIAMQWVTPLVAADERILVLPPHAPDLARVIFVHHPAREAVSPTCSDEVRDFKLISGGIRWSSDALPVPVSINPTGAENANGNALNSNAVRTAVAAAFSTWDAEVAVGIFDNPTTSSEVGIVDDGINNNSWASLSSVFPGAIAVTSIAYNPQTKAIIEVDTVFNSDVPWSTTGDVNAFDVQNAAAHESGHWLALNDLQATRDCGLTMYGSTTEGETSKRTLGTGDVRGVHRLYGP
jgi:hypothetical protein